MRPFSSLKRLKNYQSRESIAKINYSSITTNRSKKSTPVYRAITPAPEKNERQNEIITMSLNYPKAKVKKAL